MKHYVDNRNTLILNKKYMKPLTCYGLETSHYLTI
jgi:hypothetical protein